MPAKIARLATRPPFWIPEVSIAVRSSRPSCSKAEKREYSWQIGSHPGNPGLRVIMWSVSIGHRFTPGGSLANPATRKGAGKGGVT